MKVSFILFFVLLSLLQFGILLNAWSVYRSNYRPQSLRYWSLSLLLSATSYLAFAAALGTSDEVLNNSNILITVGNTLIFAGVLFQGLFARTLRVDIPVKTVWIMTALVAVYGIVFETVRHYGTFESRTAIVGILIFAIYVWQIIEIRSTRKAIKSFNLSLLFWIVMLEAIFILARAIVVYLADTQVQVLNQVPVVASLLLWVQLTLNILAYITMVGYWVEETTAQNVESKLENTKIKALLEEKDHLLTTLVNTKKIAELGAMSASISHEINQPLATVKLNAWSLKRTHETSQNLTQMQTALLEETVKGIDGIAEVVSTLRSVFKSRESPVKIISLYDFVSGLKPLIETELGSRSIALHYDIPMDLHAIFNESELTLVLLNLVNNAAKAGTKTLWINAKKLDSYIALSVIDDGQGVSSEFVPVLFEIAKGTETSGLGLGLWLSKYVVERGEGTITYTPNSPHGSVFTVNLPSTK